MGHLFANGPVSEMSIEYQTYGSREMTLSFYPTGIEPMKTERPALPGGAPVGQYPGIIEIHDRDGGRVIVTPTGKNGVLLDTTGGDVNVTLNKKMAEALIKAINDATAYSGHSD